MCLSGGENVVYENARDYEQYLTKKYGTKTGIREQKIDNKIEEIRITLIEKKEQTKEQNGLRQLISVLKEELKGERECQP